MSGMISTEMDTNLMWGIWYGYISKRGGDGDQGIKSNSLDIVHSKLYSRWERMPSS